MAGLSVAATVVPQGISYAQLAGVPSVFGLYGAFVPVWLYAATGSSKHLVRSTHFGTSFTPVLDKHVPTRRRLAQWR